MTSATGSTYQLHCSEIWGGNHDVDCDICTTGITASIYSSACDGSQKELPQSSRVVGAKWREKN